ncbi:YbaK/EbsC family protein [Roseicella frigidaeris]|uniref:YbaK/EbsC family protein n=1 Tax=Roseicella frigidaeris TaxID=2230885 RepID=A0A327M3R8_9PROT|nr:YbaK/EbsC family protein [Roseicella frigidaeris]RAI57570.1 YbaK/EbsC family protein [Roseicella frigidaeris]
MAAAGSSVERVRAALLAAGHADTITAFPEGTRSAAEAAAAVGCAVAQIAKSILFRARTENGERPVLVVASGAHRVDMARAAAALGLALEQAEGRWVREVTGFAIGGVAPLAHRTPPLVLLDEALFRHAAVWAAAGSPRHVFRTTPEELRRLSGGRVAAVAEG